MRGQTNKKLLTHGLQRSLRRNPTDAERRLWQLLRRREAAGFKFRRQHPFENYILDFVCLERKLVIEVDGGQHVDAAADATRTETLEQAGFRVLRFWNDEVLKDLDAVGQKIYTALDERGTSSDGSVNPIPTQTLPLKGTESTTASPHDLPLADQPTAAHRPIRSYVLRQGRMSVAQKRAYDQLLSRYAVAYTPEALRFAELFGRTAPTILEIGFGMGETTAAIAKAHPHNDYLGIEVHSPGVGSLLKLIDEQQLANVRLIQHDAMDAVEHMIPPDTLAGIHVFFPDPWPKTRHQKRRLIQPPFVRLLASRLVAGGYLHMATDWQEYAEQMLEVLAAEPSLVNSAAGFALRPDYRPLTKFEQRGLKLGHGVWDLIFHRKP